MVLNNDSNTINEIILRNKNLLSKYHYFKNPYDIYYKKFLTNMFYYIKQSDIYMSKNNIGKVNIKKIKNIDDIPKSIVFYKYNHYFPQIIVKHIVYNSSYSLKYSYNINGFNINLFFILFDNKLQYNTIETYDKYSYYIFNVLYLLLINNNINIKNINNKNYLNIFIYHTDLKKNIPINKNNIISSINVNTGFTSSNSNESEIVIFRKEEWFKVFIHECFHFLKLDFSNMNLDFLNKKMYKLFNIKSSFNIYEVYTEIFARLLNICFISYRLLDKPNKKMYFKYCNFFIEIEKIFSQLQSVKILNYMGLTYNDLVCNNHKCELYNENTNVLSYYILPACIFSNINSFLEWCDINNSPYTMNFKKTKYNLNKFFKYIKSLYKNEILLLNMDIINKYFKHFNNFYIINTLRMSAIEL